MASCAAPSSFRNNPGTEHGHEQHPFARAAAGVARARAVLYLVEQDLHGSRDIGGIPADGSLRESENGFAIAIGVVRRRVPRPVRARRPATRSPASRAAEFAEFRLGLDDFLEVETADEGLGPAFNGTSCAICHNIPAVGGFGTIAELRAVGRNEEGELTPLHESGETLHQLFSVPTHGCQVSIPAEVVIARRIPIPLFGAGLVEAILTRRSSRWRTRRTATATA